MFGSDGSWRDGSRALFRIKSEGFVCEKEQLNSCTDGVDPTKGSYWHEVIRHLLCLLLGVFFLTHGWLIEVGLMTRWHFYYK